MNPIAPDREHDVAPAAAGLRDQNRCGRGGVEGELSPAVGLECHAGVDRRSPLGTGELDGGP